MCLAPWVGLGCYPPPGRHGGRCPKVLSTPPGWDSVGMGCPSMGDPGHKPVSPLGAQEEVTPRMLGHAGDVQGGPRAAEIPWTSEPASPDAWGASARCAEPQNLPKRLSAGTWASLWVLPTALQAASSQTLASGRATPTLPGQCLRLPPAPPGDSGSCPSLLSVLGGLLSSPCCYFPSSEQGGE